MKTTYRGEPKDKNIETEQMIYRLKEWIASKKRRQKKD